MTDETDTTSEVARVLGEHYPDQTSYDAGDLHGCHCGWEVPRPRSSDTGDWEAYWAHQAAVLAEAGLLRAFDPDAECGVCGGTRDRAEIWRRKANRYVNRLDRLTEKSVREAIDDDGHRPGWVSAAVRRVLAIVAPNETKGDAR